jgi:DNA repair exonuclease SbcCD ATPase subunit
MSEEGATSVPGYEVSPPESNAGKWILLALALLYVAGSLYAILDYRGRLDKLEKSQTTDNAQIAALQKRVADAETSAEAIASQVGVTRRQLAEKTAELRSQQRAAESRLAKEQQEELSKVNGQVSAVSTEVGGVKTDVASTKTDLEATKARLESVRGDMGVMSGLIATTRGDLDVLKHKGDRNYFEFTLQKSKSPTPVSTVSLQLKKTDAKRGKFTMNVLADDRTIEKKDRTANEPIQFYTGRDHMLYELVVWTVDKNKVTGYLSTPKTAPQPVQPAGPGGN